MAPFSSRRTLPALLMAVFFGLASTAAAQSDGSIYSRFGLGELRGFASPQIQALGGGGTGLLPINYVNHDNPATYSDQYLTRIAAGMLFQNLEATDASRNTSRLAQGSLNAVQFSFPLRSRKLGVGLAYEPYTRTDYRVQVDGFLDPDPALADTSTYRVDFQGNGGLQQITGGVGYRISRNLSLGVRAGFVFGILDETRRTFFPKTGYSVSTLSKATRLSGVTASAGAMLSFPQLLGEEDILSLGAAFTLPTTLDGERVRTLGEPQNANRDTLGVPVAGAVTLPFSARFGLSYRPDFRWILLADARIEPWSQFESDFAWPGYAPGGTSQFQNRLRTAFGVEFLPAGADVLESYFRRVAYRIGFYYDQSYVTPPGTDIDLKTLALTGGFSLPTLFSGTRLDINFEVGTRGTTDGQLVRERYYRLSANVNIGERWFEKRKLR